MKSMKRFAAAVLSVLLLAALAVVPARAVEYEKVSPNVTAAGLGLKETLEVLGAGTPNPENTYTLTLDNIQVYSAAGVTYGDASKVVNAAGLNGKELAAVSFTSGELVGVGEMTKNYVLADGILDAINALQFDRPGIYYWTIHKVKSSTVSELTNHDRSSTHNNGTALLIRVDDNGSGALAVTVGINEKNADGTLSSNKNPEYKDNYPAKSGALTLEKEVEGNQGAKDQYFKFVVALTGMGGFNGTVLMPRVESYNTVKTATPKYGEDIAGADNRASQTITDGAATFTFWLKDGEKVQIAGIPAGAKYTVTESENEGYTVSYVIEEDGTEKASGTDDSTGERALSFTGSRVVYTNAKNSTVPTGLILQVGAPVAGIVLAAALVAVLLATRRKKERQGN